MKFLLTVVLGCLVQVCLAQNAPQKLRIQISYEKAGQYMEQAVEVIEATNIVSKATTVEYRAGASVLMLPGFQAQNGSTFTASIRPITLAKEGETSLRLAAFPSPFDQSTTIEYYLPTSGKVNLWVTNAQGQIVGRLIQNEEMSAGSHRVEWAPSSIASGIYMPIVELNHQKAVYRIVKK